MLRYWDGERWTDQWRPAASPTNQSQRRPVRTPPGWLRDPEDPEYLRWWDGEGWTDSRQHKDRQQRSDRRTLFWVLGIAGVVVVGLLLAVAVSGGTGGSGTADEELLLTGAEIACEQFVEDRLKAPATADFPDTTATGGPLSFRVRGVVDA